MFHFVITVCVCVLLTKRTQIISLFKHWHQFIPPTPAKAGCSVCVCTCTNACACTIVCILVYLRAPYNHYHCLNIRTCVSLQIVCAGLLVSGASFSVCVTILNNSCRLEIRASFTSSRWRLQRLLIWWMKAVNGPWCRLIAVNGGGSTKTATSVLCICD